MKRFIAFAFLFLCTTVAYPDAGTSTDYGTAVTIGSTYETSLDLSYRDDPNTLGHLVDRVMPSDAVWSPDGKQFFFTDSMNIYSVPVTGGTPRLLFESVYLYPYNGKTYIVNEGILAMVGFSSDGGKLYFIRNLVGEGSGATITITELEGGYSVGVTSNADPVLQSLDLETGEVATIVTAGLYGSLSSSKRYFESYISGAARIFDLEKGEGWAIPDSGTSGYAFTNCFAFDEQNIIYAYPDGEYMKFYTRPVRDGVPQEITNISPIIGQIKCVNMAPDGASIIYTVANGTNEGLYMTGLATGKTIDIVPFSTSISTNHPRFSPDGKQICYIHGSNTGYELYIKDMSAAAEELGQPTSVTDATPKGFALTGNYPNPFNPSTHIAFTLPSAGSVQMSVYDVTGQKVRDLVSSTMNAGVHEMAWDGRDASGAAVSSGTYIARLKMGNYTASHRMMLMK